MDKRSKISSISFKLALPLVNYMFVQKVFIFYILDGHLISNFLEINIPKLKLKIKQKQGSNIVSICNILVNLLSDIEIPDALSHFEFQLSHLHICVNVTIVVNLTKCKNVTISFLSFINTHKLLIP